MAGTGTAHMRHDDDTLLSVKNLVVEYKTGVRGKVHAVSDVSLDILPGETVGLVGESGCGKSTLGRAISVLTRPTEGTVRFDGTDLLQLRRSQLRRARHRIQTIFQDPIGSLNPQRQIGSIVAEGLAIQNAPKPWDDRVDEMLFAVGLSPQAVRHRRPRELSGGQAQRIVIARALMVNPSLLVCDEAVSALDVSVQAQILNLLVDLRKSFGLSMLFISHDLMVVEHIADRIAVMYLGKLCEVGPARSVYDTPRHPYTQGLLAAVPEPDPDAVDKPMEISGEPASPLNPPSGCRFRSRCPLAQPRCSAEEPIMRQIGDEHFVACHVVE